jgi:hypothetical protein
MYLYTVMDLCKVDTTNLRRREYKGCGEALNLSPEAED